MRRTAALLVPVLGLLTACSTLPPPRAPVPALPWPELRIAVITDPHILAPSLVDSEQGWQAATGGAFQMFRQGPEILAGRVAEFLADRPDLVLVTGDLTREGERDSHRAAADLLRPLTEAGIPVLVIPGNHDVLNPQASAFTAGGRRPAPSVTPGEFAALYAGLGYAGALDRDPASLSYLAEPVPGLRILALDTARYEDNARRGRQVTAGRIREATWLWIDRVLARAAADRVPVAVMMHHGLVEKFDGMGGLFTDYLVADRDEVQRRLSARGVQVVFTGHFHTLSAARAPDLPLVDIEGGTLSQYPLGYRWITSSRGSLTVETRQVGDLPSFAGRPGEFRTLARETALVHTAGLLEGRLRAARVSPGEARLLTQAFGAAFAAVTAGDPVRPEGWTWPPRGLGPMGTLAVAVLGPVPENLWVPAPPSDRSFTLALPLSSGPGDR